MSNEQKNRANRKQIETTLGQGTPAAIEQPEIQDLSILKKPINTNITGIKQLSLPNNATVEVQNYVDYECDILYECRLCRAIFRSLANFMLHKRNYCTERFTRVFNPENSSGFVIDEDAINVNRDRDCDKKQPVLETTLISDLSKKNKSVSTKDNGANQDRNVPVPLKKPNWKLEIDGDRLETIILDDETDVILEDPPNIGDNINNDDRNDIETIELLDDDKDPLIGDNNIGIVKTETVANNRPVRTRTKSYKNDFIYDLGKVLKLNDNAIKNNLGRVKRK